MALSKPAPAAKPRKAASVKKIEDVLASAKAGELCGGQLEVALPAATCCSKAIARRVVRFEVELDGVSRLVGVLEEDEAHEEEEGVLAVERVAPEVNKQVPDEHLCKPKDQRFWFWSFSCCSRSDDHDDRALSSMPASKVEKAH